MDNKEKAQCIAMEKIYALIENRGCVAICRAMYCVRVCLYVGARARSNLTAFHSLPIWISFGNE